MDSRLKYRPEQYFDKLTEYAAYTIDVVTPVGTFRQKANKQEDVIVIDEGQGAFRIYMSYERMGHFSNWTFRNPDMANDFTALVKINDDIIITIASNKFEAFILIAWYIFLATIAVINITHAEPLFVLILLPLVPVMYLLQKIKKKWLERLLINFLNTIVVT